MKYYNYETKFGLISIGEENNKIVKLSFKEIEDGKIAVVGRDDNGVMILIKSIIL